MSGSSRVGGLSFLFWDMVGSTDLLSRLGETASEYLRVDVFEALRRPSVRSAARWSRVRATGRC